MPLAAMAAILLATLECEQIDRRSSPTKTDVRLALFTYIEGWNNPRRHYNGLGQMSPAKFEARKKLKHRTLQAQSSCSPMAARGRVRK